MFKSISESNQEEYEKKVAEFEKLDESTEKETPRGDVTRQDGIKSVHKPTIYEVPGQQEILHALQYIARRMK